MTTAGSYRGLTFGTGTTTGYHVAGVEGLLDLPPVISNDLPKAVGNGVFAGTPRKGPRRVVLSLLLRAATHADFLTLVATLIAQTDDVATLNTLSLMGNTKSVQARPNRRVVPVDNVTGSDQRSTVATIEFICPDPTVS